MATYLTDEAIKYLKDNPLLQIKVSEYSGIDSRGMDSALVRKSRSLTTYKAVILIADMMSKTPVEILVDLPD